MSTSAKDAPWTKILGKNVRFGEMFALVASHVPGTSCVAAGFGE